MKGITLHPKKEIFGFSWSGLEIRQSRERGTGLGVFATRDLRVGLMIPIVGKMVNVDATGSHQWNYYRRKGIIKAIDGHPSHAPYLKVGSRGLSIAVMVNETTSKRFKTRFKLNHLVVALPIKKGQELYVDYGNKYNSYRKTYGYTLKDNQYRYMEYPTYDKLTYPSAKVRNANIDRLNRFINKKRIKDFRL